MSEQDSSRLKFKPMVPKRIVVHCSDTENGKTVSIEAMTADHISRGFGWIGYHAVIQPDGIAVWTREPDEMGCHVGGFNTGSIGICLAGRELFTVKQLDTLRYVWLTLCQRFSTISPWEVYGHYEFDSAKVQGKTCPNIKANALRYFLFLDKLSAISDSVYIAS